MGYTSRGLTAAQVLAELNKYLTNSTNKITDAVVAHIDADISSTAGAKLSILEIWGTPTNIGITDAVSTPALPDVVIPNLTGLTIEAAYAMIMSTGIGNSGAGNIYTNSNTNIQADKAAAGWINAIAMNQWTYYFPANLTESRFSMTLGSLDISARVANNATTNFRWLDVIHNLAGATLNVINLRTGIRLIVS